MPDGVALESSVGANAPVKPETPKLPWGFLKNLRGKFKRSPDNPSPNEEPYKAKDPEVLIVKPIAEEDGRQGESYLQRSYLDSEIMKTANKPGLIYTEACRFTDVGAIGMLPPTRTDAAFKEACHKLETAAYLHRTLVDFARFVKDQSDIASKDWTGATPLYRYLIGDNNGREESYNRNLLIRCQEIAKTYWQRTQQYIEEAKTKGVRYPWSEQSMFGGVWLESGAGAVKSGEPTLGRIYINPKPEHAFTISSEIEKVLLQMPSVIFHHIKVTNPDHGLRTLHLTRRDKVVIYFEAKDEKVMLETLQDLYEGWSAAPESLFNAETPPFSVGLRDKKGWKMDGFSFGQEPTDRAKNVWSKDSISFNEVRERILQKAKPYVNVDNHDQEDQDSLERKFIELATESEIDPYNPAFNLGGQKLFPTIAANSSYV